MTSVLEELEDRENKENTRLNAIQRFLEKCYEQPSLNNSVKKTFVLPESSKQIMLYLAEAGSHMERTRDILSSEVILGEENIIYSQAFTEFQECILNVRCYREAKALQFERLKDLIDEFWVHFPTAFQKDFDIWAKELAIGVAQEDLEKQLDYRLQEVLPGILEKTKTDVEIGNKLIYELAESYKRLTGARLNFIASIFNQEVTKEDTLELSVDENVSGLLELYQVDFYLWTQEQAKFLREGKLICLDVPNLLEEIEALGRQERKELKNRLGVLLGHLLKWQFQPEARSKSWTATIREQRSEILDLIEDSPSLQPCLEETMERAYKKGLNLAAKETPFDYEDFPQKCPYLLEEVLNPKFFPE